MNRDRRTRLATNRWHDSRVQFRAYLPSLIHCSAVLEGVVRFYNGRWTAVMFVTMKPTRGRRDGHGHRRTVRLHHARRPSTARNVTGPEPIKVLSVDGAGVEPVAKHSDLEASLPQTFPHPAPASPLAPSRRSHRGPGRQLQPEAFDVDDQGDETPSPRGPQSPHLQPADAAEHYARARPVRRSPPDLRPARGARQHRGVRTASFEPDTPETNRTEAP